MEPCGTSSSPCFSSRRWTRSTSGPSEQRQLFRQEDATLPKGPGGGQAGCLPPSQALGQSLPQSRGSGTALRPSLPGRVKKTTVHAVQTGEGPRKCCHGTSRGWHEWSHAPWLPRRDRLLSSQYRSRWKWALAQTWGAQNIEQLHWRSLGRLGSADQKAGQGVSLPFLVNCQGGNAPLATVESRIQPSVLWWWLTFFFPWTTVLSQPVAYLFYGLDCRRKSGLLRFWALAARTITCVQVLSAVSESVWYTHLSSQIVGLPHGIPGALG